MISNILWTTPLKISSSPNNPSLNQLPSLVGGSLFLNRFTKIYLTNNLITFNYINLSMEAKQ